MMDFDRNKKNSSGLDVGFYFYFGFNVGSKIKFEETSCWFSNGLLLTSWLLEKKIQGDFLVA
jgi:hypothetical protein